MFNIFFIKTRGAGALNLKVYVLYVEWTFPIKEIQPVGRQYFFSVFLYLAAFAVCYFFYRQFSGLSRGNQRLFWARDVSWWLP